MDSSTYLRNAKVFNLDIHSALSNVNQMEHIYIRILKSFAENAPRIIDDLVKLREDSLPRWAILIHGFKGSLYGIGAENLGDRAKILEIAAKEGRYLLIVQEIRSFIEDSVKLIKEINKLLEDLRRLEEKSDERQSLLSPDKNLLKNLLVALNSFNLEEMNAIISEINKHKYSEFQNEIKQISNCLERFDYNGAESVLLRLI